MVGFIKRRVVLIALVTGLGASAAGEAVGMPNSWAWFAGGAAIGVLWTLNEARRRRKRVP